MPRSPIRFRCFRCNKLLGVSPAKAGRVVSCPSCKAELIVPDAEPEVEEPAEEETLSFLPDPNSPEQARPGELVDTPTIIMTEPTPSRPSFPVDPISELNSAGQGQTEPDFDALNIVVARTGIEAPIAVEAEEITTLRESRQRGRDVVLPRGVVAAWSLLVLLAVFAAFGAGLLTGHYVWKLK